MLRFLARGAGVLALFLPLVANAQAPDLSGTWYSIDPNGPDNGPVQCIPTQDLAHVVAINDGVNPVHILTDATGHVTRVEFGDGPLATGYMRTAAACAADYATKQAEFSRETSTVRVEPDTGN